MRTRLSYSRNALVSTVWVRSGKVGKSWLLDGQVRTRGTHFEWFAAQSPSGRIVQLQDANGAQIACDGLTIHVSHRKGRVGTTVSRLLSRRARSGAGGCRVRASAEPRPPSSPTTDCRSAV